MKRSSVSLFLGVFIGLSLIGVVNVFAQSPPSPPCVAGSSGCPITLPNPLGVDTIEEIIAQVINILFYFGSVVLVIFIMVGAYQMLFSAGDPERFTAGRKTILYAVIGYAILLVATGIGALITGILTGAPPPPGVAPPPVQSAEDVYEVAVRILSVMQTFFWIAAAISIITAAYQFLTSSENEEKIRGAKKMLIYAAVAIVIALLATGAVDLIRNIINGV